MTASCGSPRAVIDDVTGGEARVLTVDGRAPVRVRSKYVTRIPFVLVTPGSHTFKLGMQAVNGAAAVDTVSIAATVLAGKWYRFETVDGAVRLVLETREH